MPAVHDRAGQKWSARRRWLPWRPRGRFDDVPVDVDFVSGDDPLSLVFNILMLVILIPALLLALFVAAEFLLLLVLLPLWVLARTIFGTPWVIVVRKQGEIVGHESVSGWQASGERIQQILARVAVGPSDG